MNVSSSQWRMPRDLLNIISMYAAPDDEELMIQWLCKGNKYYEEGSTSRLIGLCSASLIVRDHECAEITCDERDLTNENARDEDAPWICIQYKQLRDRGRSIGGGGHSRSYSIRKMIKFLQKQKPDRPLNPVRRFRNVKNMIRSDARNFCEVERGRWVADFWTFAKSEQWC